MLRPPAPIPPVQITGSRRVAAVQRALSENGYGQLRATGTIGADTQAAIQKFERERRLAVTGQVSDRLVRELTASPAIRSTDGACGWRSLERWPIVVHAIEIEHLGGGLFAPLPDRGRVRRGAPARRGGGGRGVRQGRDAGRQRHALRAGAADRL